jgi:hypothetical protein
MYSIDTIGIMLIYGLGLMISYNLGKNHSKQRYFELVRRLHLNYRDEMNPRSLLLFDLFDMEKLR